MYPIEQDTDYIARIEPNKYFVVYDCDRQPKQFAKEDIIKHLKEKESQ